MVLLSKFHSRPSHLYLPFSTDPINSQIYFCCPFVSIALSRLVSLIFRFPRLGGCAVPCSPVTCLILWWCLLRISGTMHMSCFDHGGFIPEVLVDYLLVGCSGWVVFLRMMFAYLLLKFFLLNGCYFLWVGCENLFSAWGLNFPGLPIQYRINAISG